MLYNTYIIYIYVLHLVFPSWWPQPVLWNSVLCPSASDPLAALLPFPAFGLPLALSVCKQALPFSVCREPGTPKKILSPCSLILPRLDGAASRVGSYMPWSPGSSFSLNYSFCSLCKKEWLLHISFNPGWRCLWVKALLQGSCVFQESR